jgi:hypothetical protein
MSYFPTCSPFLHSRSTSFSKRTKTEVPCSKHLLSVSALEYVVMIEAKNIKKIVNLLFIVIPLMIKY